MSGGFWAPERRARPHEPAPSDELTVLIVAIGVALVAGTVLWMLAR